MDAEGLSAMQNSISDKSQQRAAFAGSKMCEEWAIYTEQWAISGLSALASVSFISNLPIIATTPAFILTLLSSAIPRFLWHSPLFFEHVAYSPFPKR